MRRWLYGSAVAVSLVAGCARPESQIVGKWTVDTSAISTGSSQWDSIAKGFAQSVSIEFKPDHTFHLTLFIAVEGTYTMDGRTVHMRPTKVAGNAVDPSRPKDRGATTEMEATLSDDGKTLSVSENGKTTKFIKSAS